MFVYKSSFLTRHRGAGLVALGALLLTSSALCLTGCGGSKPADPGPGPNGGLAHTPAQDQQILKEAAEEKPHPNGGGAAGGGALAPDGGK